MGLRAARQEPLTQSPIRERGSKACLAGGQFADAATITRSPKPDEPPRNGESWALAKIPGSRACNCADFWSVGVAGAQGGQTAICG